MGQPIEMVFLDIDGTIVVNGVLVDSALEAVTRLRERNISVALCTGRALVHTRAIREALGVNHTICFNGGLVISDGEEIYSTPLLRNTVEKVIEFCTENNLAMVLHSDTTAMAFDDIPAPFQPILTDYDYPPLRKVTRESWKTHERDIFQFNVFIDHAWDEQVTARFPECLLYRWDKQAVDLQRRGCDKRIGAQHLLHRLDIAPEKAVHFGDGGNDVGMFQFTGYSVAMGNASQEVQIHADKVTKPAWEDGVWYGLRELELI